VVSKQDGLQARWSPSKVVSKQDGLQARWSPSKMVPKQDGLHSSWQAANLSEVRPRINRSLVNQLLGSGLIRGSSANADRRSFRGVVLLGIILIIYQKSNSVHANLIEGERDPQSD
ncbi:hypothetical protein B0O80DRAFT_457732, partial [Mortierella sp. GBAus27b]